MRMFRTSVYMQFLDDVIAQTIVRNHPADSHLDHADRILLQHIAGFDVFVTAQVSGMTEINLLTCAALMMMT